MKKLLFTLAIVASSSLARAQSNVVKLGVAGAFVKIASAWYERKITPTASAQIGLVVEGSKVIGSTRYAGFSVLPEARFYLGGAALRGLYVGPYMQYQRLSLEQAGDLPAGQTARAEGTLTTVGGGVVLGYQWLLGQRWCINPSLGMGYNTGSLSQRAGAAEALGTSSFKGLQFRPALNLGFAF